MQSRLPGHKVDPSGFRLDPKVSPHQNLGLPNTNSRLPPEADGSVEPVHVAGCSFGRITNIQTNPRAMEFALKFFF